MACALPRLCQSGTGQNIRCGDLSLYDELDPRGGAERRAARIKLEERCLLLIPSPALGYGLETVLNRLPPSSHVLALEADQNIFRLCSGALNGFANARGCTIIRTDSIDLAVGVARGLGLHRFRRVQTLRLSRGDLLHRQFYEASERGIVEALRLYWRNRATAVALGGLWTRNLLLNAALLPSSADARGLCIDKPMLLAGAGESLEDHLDFIAAERGRLCVAVVDTALPVLTGYGIRPDIVFAADAQLLNVDDFSGLQGAAIDLVADILVHPAIAGVLGGRRYFFMSRFSEEDWFERAFPKELFPDPIPALGSIALMAYALLRRQSDLPILLAGLDFHYRSGKTHARGSPSARRELLDSTRLRRSLSYGACLRRPRAEALGGDGARCATDAVLLDYHQRFEALSRADTCLWRLGPARLASRVPSLSPRTAAELVRSTPCSRTPLPGWRPATPRGRPAAAPELLRDWYEKTARGLASARRQLSQGERPDELGPAAFDFPEYPDFDLSDPLLVARLGARIEKRRTLAERLSFLRF